MPDLRVDTAALLALATRWGTVAGELAAAENPNLPAISEQPSAAAVSAAHADVRFFTAALANRVDGRASHVADASVRYVAGEDHSAGELGATIEPTTTT